MLTGEWEMGRKKPISTGPKLQSSGANRSGTAALAPEAEVSRTRGAAIPQRFPYDHERSAEPLQPSTCRPPRGDGGSTQRSPSRTPRGQQGWASPRREEQRAAQASTPLLLRSTRHCIFKPRCSIPLRPITARADPGGEWQPSPRFFKPSLSTNRRPALLAPPPRSPHPNRFQRVWELTTPRARPNRGAAAAVTSQRGERIRGGRSRAGRGRRQFEPARRPMGGGGRAPRSGGSSCCGG